MIEQPNRTVLLVEDTVETAELISTFLRKICSIDHATDASQAYSRAATKRYDLVLMDINLGTGPTGLDVTRRLRSDPRYAAVPIIALTAYAMRSDREIALGAGCTDYLSKPFTKEALQTLVRNHLGLEIEQ